MKLAPLFCCVVLAACASAQKPTASTAMLTSAEAETKTAAELWAERRVATDPNAVKTTMRREGGDPLGMNSELEESSIPKTEFTPASQLWPKSPAALNAAVGVVKSARSVEEAAKKLGQRLGKPSWTESPKGSDNSKRRIWVAPAGAQCHRLILEPDGTVEVETAPSTEWRMLTASARQNPCSGEINRGISR